MARDVASPRSLVGNNILWFVAAVVIASIAGAHGANGESAAAGEVVHATLTNGLRVIAVHTPGAGAVATVVNYLAGGNESPAEFPGLAHAREHMMFRGSPGLTGAQLSELAAALGGRFNAVTRPTVTQYFFTVPAEDLNAVLRLEALRMRAVLDTEADWTKEQRAIQREIAEKLSDPEYLLYQRVLGVLFDGSLYERDVLGTKESFERTSGSIVRTFHRAWYGPNNAIVVVAGDVEPERMVAQIRRHFEAIPPRQIPPKRRLELKAVEGARLEVEGNEPRTWATFWFRMPGMESQDFAAAAVLAGIIGSEAGPLHTLVRRGEALSVDFSLEELPGVSIGCVRVAIPSRGDAAAIEIRVREILSGIGRSGVPGLVDGAKQRLILEAELEKSSVLGLAIAWARVVAIAGGRSPEDRALAVDGVSASDVARVGNEWLDPDRAVVGWLTPRDSVGAVSAMSERSNVTSAPEENSGSTLPDWAATSLRRQRRSAPPSAAAVFSLTNGIQLMVQPTRGTRAVIVVGTVDRDVAAVGPEGKEGVREVLNTMLSFGAASSDRSAFRRALFEIGARGSVGADFSLRVLVDHLDRGVELLAHHLLPPRFEQEAFRRAQREVAARISDALTSPEYVVPRALRRLLLPPGDPQLREATPSTIESLSLDDVRAHYGHTFHPTRTKIAVVGDVDPARVRAVFAKHFGSWKGSGREAERLLPPLPENRPHAVAIPDPTRKQSNVVLAQTLALVRPSPDYYALEIGNHVLTQGFNASRLYRSLRESAGLVYRVSSSLDVHRSRSFYSVNFVCDPGDTARARAIVVRELERMQTAPVTAEEFERARSSLIRELRLAQSGSEEIAHSILKRAVQGLPLEEPQEALRRYSELTPEDVGAAFARWIRPRGLATVVHGGQG